MTNEKKRSWRELCEAASKEQNSKQLLALISELMEALDESNVTGNGAATREVAA